MGCEVAGVSAVVGAGEVAEVRVVMVGDVGEEMGEDVGRVEGHGCVGGAVFDVGGKRPGIHS